MKLKANPYQVFDGKDDPISLYVRRTWLQEDGQTQKSIERIISYILGKQLDDGSWNHYTAHTIENLFALWLLVDKVIDPINSAVDWLLEQSNPPSINPNRRKYKDIFCRFTSGEKPETKNMRNVPFTRGCFVYVKTGAALFFATQFNRQNEEAVSKAYEFVNREAIRRNGRHCSGSCGSNLRLAMAVHPQYNNVEGMHHVLNYLASQQKPTGSWSDAIPFYPTVYLLSYLNTAAANVQFEQALARVRKLQRNDGSWGNAQQVRDTFLVLDSLQRKNVDWSI